MPFAPWKLRAIAALVGALLAAGCSTGPVLSSGDDRIQVIATTGILRDLIENVGGDRVRVAALVPDRADPHSYEPSLRDVRNVVYADVAFSNYLLLEQHAIVKALDANLPPGVPNISLAEASVRYAAELIPLVENVALDTIWLGMRVRGSGVEHGASRVSDIELRAVQLDGPGDVVAYLTESFGNPVFYVDSTDGFDPSDGYRDDTATLPPAAHTHMSWAFTEPGIYRLTMEGHLAVAPDQRPLPMGRATFTFAVGVDPHRIDGMTVEHVLDGGHADIAVDLDRGEVQLFADPHGGGDASQHVHDPETTVIVVPNSARQEVPGDPGFRFLGRPGDPIYLLPQAVLGRHVHGEIDPHLWHDVRNAMAYVELVRDTLIEVDPSGAAEYRANAAAYLGELEALDAEVRRELTAIPSAHRHLVTTHDAFAYLAAAYDLEISGFVTPHPATEPSLADRRRVTDTIRNLAIPAVFLEPNLAARSSTLQEVAREEGIEVCPIYGDVLDDRVRTYAELMRFNARSLRACLAPDRSADPPEDP